MTKCKINDKYNKLIITKFWSEKSDNKKPYIVCICVCDCGKIITVPFKYLTNSHKKSCGCGRVGLNKNNKNGGWKGYEEISGSVYSSIKSNAKIRNIVFDITIEELWNLFVKQNRKCAISGVAIRFSEYQKTKTPELNTASLDRIDSSLPYTIDNVQWVHKDINCMKMALPQDEFIFWCNAVADFN